MYSSILASIDWSNSWIVGIGTGTISGVAVAFIVSKASNFFLSRKNDKEYRQKIYRANQEVIYALRPSIAEAMTPSRDIVEALIDATARKYQLKRTDLNTIEQFSDDLIKEVLDSSFISNQQRLKYCEEVSKIKVSPNPSVATAPEPIDDIVVYANKMREYNQKRTEQTTQFLSVTAGLLAAISATLATFVDKFNIYDITSPSVVLASTIAILGAILMAIRYLFPGGPKDPHQRKKG